MRKTITRQLEEVLSTVLRKKGKKEIDDLKKKYFSRSRTEAETELKSLFGDTAYLVELLEEFEQIFREKKREGRTWWTSMM